MRIAYVLATFPSISETFILREVLALREKGMELVIFSLRRDTSDKVHPGMASLQDCIHHRAPLLSRRTLFSQLHFLRRMPCRYLRLLFAVLAGVAHNPIVLLKVIRNFPVAVDFARQAERLGVSHVHAHFAFIPADIAAVMAGLLDLEHSLAVHAWDIYAQKKEPLATRIKRAAFVVTCTQHGHDYLKSMFSWLPEQDVVTIRHGIMPAQFTPAATEGELILAVGRLSAKKGFRHLVRSCHALKTRGRSVRCIIAGDGPERKHIEDLIEQLDLAADVLLRGELAQDELLDLYAQAAIMVAPSVALPSGDMDGLPNVLIEALAMGIPVVSTSISAIPELIEDGVNGYLVAPGDVPALADRIADLLDNADLRRKMGERGRARVVEEFDITRNSEELMQLFSRYRKTGGAAE